MGAEPREAFILEIQFLFRSKFGVTPNLTGATPVPPQISVRSSPAVFDQVGSLSNLQTVLLKWKAPARQLLYTEYQLNKKKLSTQVAQVSGLLFRALRAKTELRQAEERAR